MRVDNDGEPGSLLIVHLVIFFFFFFFHQKMGALVSKIAFPHPPKEYSEDELKDRRDLKSLTTKSGLKIPAIHVARAGSDFTLIYSHGNAEDVGLSLFLLDMMSEILDVSVIAYEYPGYSISDGEPSEVGCYEAIDAAYHYATKTVEIDPKKIVFYGRSLGTGPSVDKCSRCPDVAGCILESPLESGIRCAIGVRLLCLFYVQCIYLIT